MNKDKILQDYLVFLDSVFLGSLHICIFIHKETFILFWSSTVHY